MSDAGGGELGLRTPFGPGAYEIAALSAGLVIGAVESASDTWYRNWTCDSTTVDFGSSTGDCTSIPVY